MSESIPTSETPASATANLPAAWVEYINPFAKAIGQTVEQVTRAFKDLAGDPGDPAIEVLKSGEYTSFEDISTALASLGVAKAILKKAVQDHLRKKSSEPAPVVPATHSNASYDILPAAPNDESWLALLKTGGRLTVDTTTVISAMRAALAARSGLFELPAKLKDLMERHAESLDEPVGSQYYEMEALLTRRNYGEIFQAMGIDGRTHATQAKKAKLHKRIDELLWPALIGFQRELKSWMDVWQQSFNNPAMLMPMLTASMSGRGGAMPPGIGVAPPTDTLRSAAESVFTQVSRTFAGTGVPTATAMAFDAVAIKKVLTTPGLPALVGAANYDQMIKLLEVDVSADYIRLEQNVVRYALAVMDLPKVTADAEPTYLSALVMLGTQIPWEKISAPARRKGPSSYTPDIDEDGEEDGRFDRSGRRGRS